MKWCQGLNSVNISTDGIRHLQTNSNPSSSHSHASSCVFHSFDTVRPGDAIKDL